MVSDKDESVWSVTEGGVVTPHNDFCLTRRTLMLGMLAGVLQLVSWR